MIFDGEYALVIRETLDLVIGIQVFEERIDLWILSGNMAKSHGFVLNRLLMFLRGLLNSCSG
jgi:hypothetical protein